MNKTNITRRSHPREGFKLNRKLACIISIFFLLLSQFAIFQIVVEFGAAPDTFGYTTIGASQTSIVGNQLRATKFTCPKSGQADSITVYIKSYGYNPKIKCAIYADNDDYPENLVGYTEEWTLTSGWDGWKTFNIVSGGQLQANMVYWLVYWANNYAYLKYDSGDSGQHVYKTVTYDGFPDPFPSGGGKKAQVYSIYCTYTPSADTQAPTYSNIATNTTLAGAVCQFSVLWNDNANVSGYIFGTNNTGTWQNETWVAFSVFYNSTAAWSNVTKTLNSTVDVRVEWTVWCNDTSNNWNTTGTQYLTTTPTGYALNLRVMDSDLSDAISGALVYKDSDVKVSDANGWANWTEVSGSIQIQVKYFGFWVNGTSIEVTSDTTLYLKCNLFDIYVKVLPNNQQGILYQANVTVYNASSVEGNKIHTALTNQSGYASLLNLPNNTLTFTIYGGPDYSIVIANVTRSVTSDEEVLSAIVCDQNYADVDIPWEIMIYVSSQS